ncbi:MAG: LamG domain-containing protein, partial [Bacteroidaceae bacterium]|nr:LamG domain-containing protein [Bacteroidaceae bacterium]
MDLLTSSESIKDTIKVDNYKASILYPRIYRASRGRGEWWSGALSACYSWYKDYPEYKVAGFPRPVLSGKGDPTSQEANAMQAYAPDAYKKEAVIKWYSEVDDPDNFNADGVWRIFRKNVKTGKQIKLGDVPFDKSGNEYTYTDDKGDLEYDNDYVYTVCFAPSGWNVVSEKDAEGLSGYVNFKLERSFKFTSFTSTSTKSDVTIEWTHPAISSASGANSYKVTLQRSEDDGQTWTELKSYNITSPKTTSGSYVDPSSNLKSLVDYSYRLKIYVQDKELYSDVIVDGLKFSSEVTEMVASRGTYGNIIKLQWKVDQSGSNDTYFELFRRPLGSNDENEYKQVYTTVGTQGIYSFDDVTANAGSFYEYKLKIYILSNNGTKKQLGVRTYKTDGFCSATGVISGRVYYDSGTAVSGVKVALTPSNTDGETVSQFRSLLLQSNGAGLKYATTNSEIVNTLFAGDFSYQLYLNPNKNTDSNINKVYEIFDVYNTFTTYLKYISAKKGYQVGVKLNGQTKWSNMYVVPEKWTHLTVVYDSKTATTTVYNTYSTSPKAYVVAKDLKVVNNKKSNCIALGNAYNFKSANPYVGHVDEFRFFTKALTSKEIANNYSRTLAGTENNLAIYWPMDEGLGKQQPIAYDFSSTNEIPNGRHAKVMVAAESSTKVPDKNKLSLCGYTDNEGNYMIRGIRFSGNGTNYVVTPTLGVHKFNASSSSRYISLNSLVHSGVDFTDVSSFKVTGRVLYQNTTIPVEGANLYVDGILASKDGDPIMTDVNGEYTIDVPIGDHFINIKMNGHTFENGGRYPVDKNDVGEKFTFEKETKIDFVDNTKVIVAGRVAGGEIEYGKPLGLNQGIANIGSATITLDFPNSDTHFINAVKNVNGASVSYEKNESRLDYERATDNIESYTYVEGNKNQITIITDSTTGEFAAYLPPLKYTTKSIIINSQKDIDFSKMLPNIDASNAAIEFVDSLIDEEGRVDYFKYCASANVMYKSPSVLKVTENEDGSFGENKVYVTDVNKKKTEVATYTVNKNGSVKYSFGYPIYEELKQYCYDIYAYETYKNFDEKNVVTTEVPLRNAKVTIKNQYASSTSVKMADGSVSETIDDSFELDSLGHAKYYFTAGLPNIQSP